MKPAERDRLTQETHQALLGVKGTEDKGLVGDFKELKAVVKEHNKGIEQNRLDIRGIKALQNERGKPSKKAITMYISGAAGIVAALWRAFMGH